MICLPNYNIFEGEVGQNNYAITTDETRTFLGKPGYVDTLNTTLSSNGMKIHPKASHRASHLTSLLNMSKEKGTHSYRRQPLPPLDWFSY